MEPRPDGRGKPKSIPPFPGWIPPPQWSPGLMAGGSKVKINIVGDASQLPQWSPGLKAGGRRCSATLGGGGYRRRNGAPA